MPISFEQVVRDRWAAEPLARYMYEAQQRAIYGAAAKRMAGWDDLFKPVKEIWITMARETVAHLTEGMIASLEAQGLTLVRKDEDGQARS